MLTKDKLWKAIFEDFFPQAILFYFPDSYTTIDWPRGYELLDKELREISPESDNMGRRADLLVKVWLLNGTEQWILIHVEVQGYKDEKFGKRMFTTFYRIIDRFDVPVSALALLTDTNKNWLPDTYKLTCMGTENTYKFPVFKLMDYTEKDFDNNPNPWAIVMKAALIGLHGNWTDEALLRAKVRLYKELRQRGYSIEQVRHLLVFFKFHVRFQEKDYFRKFETEIKKIDNIKQQPMGIIELVKEHLIEEAREEGMEKGMEKGELKQAITSIYNMHKKGFQTKDMAEILGVSKQLVFKIQKQLAKEQAIREEIKTAIMDNETISSKLKVHPLLVQVVREAIK